MEIKRDSIRNLPYEIQEYENYGSEYIDKKKVIKELENSIFIAKAHLKESPRHYGGLIGSIKTKYKKGKISLNEYMKQIHEIKINKDYNELTGIKFFERKIRAVKNNDLLVFISVDGQTKMYSLKYLKSHTDAPLKFANKVYEKSVEFQKDSRAIKFNQDKVDMSLFLLDEIDEPPEKVNEFYDWINDVITITIMPDSDELRKMNKEHKKEGKNAKYNRMVDDFLNELWYE